MEVKALCLDVGDCWCLLNIIVEIAIRKFSFYFTHICLFFVNCFVLCFEFCLFVLCVVCHISHPNIIVKFTYHIGDNVKFKCGGENWVRSSQKVSKFSNFFKFQ